MNIQYKKLSEKDLDTFIEIRIRQLREPASMAAALSRSRLLIWEYCCTPISDL